ncbi:hypothetical protein HPP92_016162 [Vanilla planifolia]|uniref:Probable purine permease n=1 Tax=Vanilla planifolia TaxID=51239 RepID=A0A835QIM4_VANPL|nr:hypothetical protein HPP92_016162 [Vanilla planifolia]
MVMEAKGHAEPQATADMGSYGRQTTTSRRGFVLSLNLFLLIIGSGANPLLLRLYFLKGGRRIWFSTFLQTAGFPVLLPPLLLSYLRRRRYYVQHSSNPEQKPKLFFLTPALLLYCTLLGLLTGVVDLLYAYGLAFLPVSTSSLLFSTELAFTAFFSFFIVRQRFTSFSINAIVLLSLGAVMLGLHASSDRPARESQSKYYLGFAMTLGSAVFDGLLPTLTQLMYAKAKQGGSYTLVMESQLVMAFSATAFCAVGMAANNEFQGILLEAKGYELGEAKYYLVVVSLAVLTQLLFLGRVGVVLYSSALLSGLVLALLLPMTEVLAVIFFHEPFDGDKIVALGLSLWGFASYLYGERIEYTKNKSRATETQLSVSV